MSANSSFAGTLQLPSKPLLVPIDCFIFRKSMLILVSFSITNILLILPLSTYILYLGYQRWRHQRSTAAVAVMNQSNIFTYQMVAMEVTGVLGCFLYCVGINASLSNMLICGFYMFFSTYSVKIHFHTLTCVQHYLAVVHPVTYVGLKNKRRSRIRTFNIACVWLMCFLFIIVMNEIYLSLSLTIYFIFMVFALIVVCFCCISVLCALRQPGPGEVGRDKKRIHQMKQRAFNTVVAIMGALWLCLGGTLVCIAYVELQTLSDSDECSVLASAVWFSFPCSFVLPLQYLHRAGKLPGCKHHIT